MKITLALLSLSLAVFSMIRFTRAGAAWAAENTDMKAVVKGNTAFAFDLYSRLKAEEGNLFFSPYSVSAALAMTYAGARGGTAEQMAKTLHFAPGQEALPASFAALEKTLESEKGYELRIANALWAQEGYQFLKEFLDTMEKDYGAGLHPVDFATAAEAARKEINGWVEKKTKGKIRELFAPGILNAMTRLVLTNAIYFKGQWASRFRESLTAAAPFTVAPGETVDVPMMHQEEEFRYMESDSLQALELPYRGHDLSMVVLLPRKVEGIAALEKALTPEKLDAVLGRMWKREVVVYLPRFKTESRFGLAATLGAMGMPAAFSRDADFSGMNGARDLFISAVVHKAFVEVNEEGTEAAAATGVGVELAAAPMPTPVFRADHPFVFLIRDKRSGSILFLGRLANPAA